MGMTDTTYPESDIQAPSVSWSASQLFPQFRGSNRPESARIPDLTRRFQVAFSGPAPSRGGYNPQQG